MVLTVRGILCENAGSGMWRGVAGEMGESLYLVTEPSRERARRTRNIRDRE